MQDNRGSDALETDREQQLFFVLRVREEKVAGTRTEWRGEVLDVDRNMVRSFEDWPEMVELIADALHTSRSPACSPDESLHSPTFQT